ncbi:hypothetical protein [Paraburkholderia nodosa]|uniref:hypothetical protein n=1 Tax=Paraburkholderia nodosa TaxID=392320 RepID=UPI0004840CC3|nr:hypothetical protein [Paraburkholderia nodosa]
MIPDALLRQIPYNRFAPGPFGLPALMGAASYITLTAPALDTDTAKNAVRMILTDVDGRTFAAPVSHVTEAVPLDAKAAKE